MSIYAAAAKSLQSCPTLCDSQPGSPVPGILKARALEWVAISFSAQNPRRSTQNRGRSTKNPGKSAQNPGRPTQNPVQFSSVQSLSRVRLFATP